MTKLVIATTNPGKLEEFRAGLAGLALEPLSASDAGISGFPEETGSSYQENASIKARHAAKLSGLPSLADDSGLEVNALNGAPGLYSARFGGDLSNAERIAYLLEQLRGIPKDARSARFVCSLVLVMPARQTEQFEGRCEGRILDRPAGDAGFGYDPIFYSSDLAKSFAEASEAEKRQVSHRGRALAAFVSWVKATDALP